MSCTGIGDPWDRNCRNSRAKWWAVSASGSSSPTRGRVKNCCKTRSFRKPAVPQRNPARSSARTTSGSQIRSAQRNHSTTSGHPSQKSRYRFVSTAILISKVPVPLDANARPRHRKPDHEPMCLPGHPNRYYGRRQPIALTRFPKGTWLLYSNSGHHGLPSRECNGQGPALFREWYIEYFESSSCLHCRLILPTRQLPKIESLDLQVERREFMRWS